MYFNQGHGYMALTGAKKHSIVYCLVNGTQQAIDDEKRRLAYAMHVLDPSARNNPEYIEKCKQIEINHIFDIQAFMKEYPWYEFENDANTWQYDIPMEERIFIQSFERDDVLIDKINGRVKECRKWITNNLL
jgi:hypothetical protein